VDVLLGALDSRRARQVLASEMGWPLGVPVVDGGVGEGLLGRVQVFLPGPSAACLECTWGREDYRQLAAEYPCQPGAAAEGRPTVSTAFLGNFTATVMAGECLRVLAGRAGADSYEVPFDLTHYQFRRYLLRRSGACRHDHEVIGDTVILAKKDSGPPVQDVLAVIADRFGDAPVQVECRRGLGSAGPLGATRFLPLDALRARARDPLWALGFLPSDRLRVRHDGRSVFIALSPAGRDGERDGVEAPWVRKGIRYGLP
jgi:hypothetical protein